MNRIRIFVSSYACEPERGSEIGVGWHWVLEMNKYFELWVLTRKANQLTIEPWLKEHPQEYEIHFIYYDTPYWMRFYKKGMRGVRLYYCIWQQMTNKIVKKNMESEQIDIFHLLTYGNALWPFSSYGQTKFCIIGPTGGVDSIPWDYVKHYSLRWKLIEGIRRFMVKTLTFNYTFRKQMRNANLILCKSNSIFYAIPQKYRYKAVLFTDVAVEQKNADKFLKTDFHDSKVRFIIVGKLDAWRGFDLLIEAMDKAVKHNKNLHLDIIGGGAEADNLRRMIEKRALSAYIQMTGVVCMNDYYQKMADCDVVVNPCLKEGAVTTSFDSMSFKKPLICIDTGGYTRYFDNNCAIVIPQGRRDEVILQLSNAILRLTDADERKRLANEAHRRGLSYTWEDKGKAISKVIIQAYQKNRK